MMNDDRDSTQRDCGGAMAVPCRATVRTNIQSSPLGPSQRSRNGWAGEDS
jgi:hypothetical protein